MILLGKSRKLDFIWTIKMYSEFEGLKIEPNRSIFSHSHIKRTIKLPDRSNDRALFDGGGYNRRLDIEKKGKRFIITNDILRFWHPYSTRM